jgi:hypothetical protein
MIFMNVSEIREKPHQYIDKTDETLLTEIYQMITEEDAPFNYTADEIAMFYKRREAYQNGEGKNYTVQKSLNNIRR